ncbi:MAG TPA: sigma-70 factor domain-containing protein, partial [Pseudobdellovibrionaceae bacterium]|nr:sigma-70 factor domain-containing protein [Pseudobdellovibrionaceae bacterium]
MKPGTPNTKEPAKSLSLAEQEAVIKEEIQRFLKMAKEKGSLMIEEINELLPPEIVAPSVLDTLMHALEQNGVVITDLSEVNKAAEEGDSPFLADPAAEGEEKDEDEVPEEEDVKSNDPVRLYLRKMGSVSLLTREGEVEIARRIEKGEREIVRA